MSNTALQSPYTDASSSNIWATPAYAACSADCDVWGNVPHIGTDSVFTGRASGASCTIARAALSKPLKTAVLHDPSMKTWSRMCGSSHHSPC